MCVTSTRDHQSSSNTIICEGLGALEAEEQLGLELADAAAGGFGVPPPPSNHRSAWSPHEVAYQQVSKSSRLFMH